METVFLVVRWAAALFLLMCVCILPFEYVKKRNPKHSAPIVLALVIFLGGIFASTAASLISASWQPLLLTLRIGLGALLILAGVNCLINIYRKRNGPVLAVLHLCSGLILAGIGLAIATLNWTVLLASLAGLLLSGGAVLLVRVTNIRMSVKALQQLAVKTRSIPMPLEEAKERMSMGEGFAYLSLQEEARLGRIMSAQELADFASESNRAFAESRLEQEKAGQGSAEAQLAAEQAAMAIKLEMKTDSAAPRSISINLAKALEITGTSGENLLLPAGQQQLWLMMSLEKPPEDDDGYPVVMLEIANGSGAKVKRKFLLTGVIDLTDVKAAASWKAQEVAWQQSFAGNVLLEAVECVEDNKEWITFPVDDVELSFYSRSGSFWATLACPAPQDRIWCRVHALEYMEFDAEDEPMDWKTADAFCFPLDIDNLLTIDEHIE